MIGRVRSIVDAHNICHGRMDTLREAGNRASDLRRFQLQARRMESDLRGLMGMLESLAQVLKQVRPRDVVRAREEIRQLLRRMKGRGYVK